MEEKKESIKSAKYFKRRLEEYLYGLFCTLYDTVNDQKITATQAKIAQAISATLFDITHFINHFDLQDNNEELEKLKMIDKINDLKEIAAKKLSGDELKGYIDALNEVKRLYKPDYTIDANKITVQFTKLTDINKELDKRLKGENKDEVVIRTEGEEQD